MIIGDGRAHAIMRAISVAERQSAADQIDVVGERPGGRPGPGRVEQRRERVADQPVAAAVARSSGSAATSRSPAVRRAAGEGVDEAQRPAGVGDVPRVATRRRSPRPRCPGRRAPRRTTAVAAAAQRSGRPARRRAAAGVDGAGEVVGAHAGIADPAARPSVADVDAPRRARSRPRDERRRGRSRRPATRTGRRRRRPLAEQAPDPTGEVEVAPACRWASRATLVSDRSAAVRRSAVDGRGREREALDRVAGRRDEADRDASAVGARRPPATARPCRRTVRGYGQQDGVDVVGKLADCTRRSGGALVGTATSPIPRRCVGSAQWGEPSTSAVGADDGATVGRAIRRIRQAAWTKSTYGCQGAQSACGRPSSSLRTK